MPHPTDLAKFFLAANSGSRDEARSLFTRVMEFGTSFKTSPKVFPGNFGAVPSQVTFQHMPGAGLSNQQLIQEFEDIAKHSTNWSSANFLGFPDAANNIAGLAAAILVPMLNQNMANQYICSPKATFMKMEVIHWLRRALGYSLPTSYSAASGIGGVEALGGCLSNAIALMAAREKLFPDSGTKGIPVVPSKIRVLVPDVIEHYSIRSGVAWLSLGEQNVIRIPVNENSRMDQVVLKRTIRTKQDRGHHILACVAYAGDSRNMQVDDLEGLAQTLRHHNIWFHVDACHRSQLVFSAKHKHKLRGIEKADSATVDPHKTLFLPYNCSFVLFRDPAAHAAIATNSDLILNTHWSLGQITPFIGSKSFNALKLWTIIKSLGKNGLGQLIDERLELTEAIQSEIRGRSHFVLMNETNINSCMMLFIPEKLQQYCLQNKTRLSDSDLKKVNKVNYLINEGIRTEGTFYMYGFPLKRCSHEDFINPRKRLYVLRTMNGNPASTIENVQQLLDKIEQLGQQIFEDSQYQISCPTSPSARLQRLKSDLDENIREILGDRGYVAVIYGSSALGENALLSDIDLMVFVDDTHRLPCKALETKF